MELKTLCVILCIAVWEVTSLHVEGPTMPRYRPCLGRLYFDKLSKSYWKCNIDLVQYTDRDNITTELRLKNDIYLTFMYSPSSEVIIRKFQPYTIYTKRPIPSKLEFIFKLTDYIRPRVLEFTVDNVTLCSPELQGWRHQADLYHPEESRSSPKNKANDVEENQCGMKHYLNEDLIFLRKNSKTGDWPWHVAVIANKAKICGGTIVSRTAVITVDYCVKDVQTNQVEVIAGTTTPLINRDEGGRQTYQAREILTPTEDKGYFDYKLAIIKVDGITFAINVRPICLFNAEQSHLFGNEVMIVGFGGQTAADFSLKAVNTHTPLTNKTDEHNDITFCSELGPLSSSYADNGNAGSALVASTVAADGGVIWFLKGVDITCLPRNKTKGMYETLKIGLFINIALHYDWIKTNAGL